MSDVHPMVEKLPGEGDTKTVTSIMERVGCDECGEPAVFKHTYLLKDARRNPASTAYGKDDCSWCSDAVSYTCREHRRPAMDGHDWCATFECVPRFYHMFLRWRETKVVKTSAESEGKA
mgnify:FL=1